jgi:hypothetical protein
MNTKSFYGAQDGRAGRHVGDRTHRRCGSVLTKAAFWALINGSIEKTALAEELWWTSWDSRLHPEIHNVILDPTIVSGTRGGSKLARPARHDVAFSVIILSAGSPHKLTSNRCRAQGA